MNLDNKMKKSITALVKEYFQMHPFENLYHGPVVDWVEEQYLKIYNRKPRDIWRAIRKLHEEGFLVKVRKGIYRFEPDSIKNKKLIFILNGKITKIKLLNL